jgi:hypothetical protein
LEGSHHPGGAQRPPRPVLCLNGETERPKVPDDVRQRGARVEREGDLRRYDVYAGLLLDDRVLGREARAHPQELPVAAADALELGDAIALDSQFSRNGTRSLGKLDCCLRRCAV